MKDTIKRLRELEKKDRLSNNEIQFCLNALPQLLDYIDSLEKDNLGLVEDLTTEGIKLSQLRGECNKYQRREDEHCRQIVKKIDRFKNE